MCAAQGSTRTTCHHPSHHEPSLKHLLNNNYPTYQKSTENSIHPATNLTTVFQGLVFRPLPRSKNKNQNSVHPATNLTTVVQGHFFRPPLPIKQSWCLFFTTGSQQVWSLNIVLGGGAGGSVVKYVDGLTVSKVLLQRSNSSKNTLVLCEPCDMSCYGTSL